MQVVGFGLLFLGWGLGYIQAVDISLILIKFWGGLFSAAYPTNCPHIGSETMDYLVPVTLWALWSLSARVKWSKAQQYFTDPMLRTNSGLVSKEDGSLGLLNSFCFPALSPSKKKKPLRKSGVMIRFTPGSCLMQNRIGPVNLTGPYT